MLAGVLLLTLLSVSAISADTIVMDNYTFEMPDGYVLIENDTQLVMYNDQYIINLYQGPIINTTIAKQKRINNGFTFLGEENYDFDGIKINQQNYNIDGYNDCIYTFKKNNKDFIVSIMVDEKDPVPDYENNPVTGIINSLK